MKKKFWQRRKFWKRFLLVSVILLGIAYTAAHFIGKRLGYNGALDFISSVGSHYSRGISADYKTIDIKISKADFKKIEVIRNRAMQAGMQLDEADPWVKGKITYKGNEIKIKLRLKGHMTDHLEGKKWSFRIKTRKGNAFEGMRIFSLQHPGTRNYAYEWIFHEVMKKEGLIALNYDFINVNLNGDNLGIYALEENFGEELIERNKRPNGPILRFNTDLYWVFRYNELQGNAFMQEGAQWKSSYLEPTDDDEVFSDSSLLRSYSGALLLMNEFRKGNISTSQAFDYKALAKYHAWIDIIGGTGSLELTDVKYYYNPSTRLLEPVAYESFSAYPVYSLSGQFRCTGDAVNREDLHDLFFSDTVFFKEYMHQLTVMSSEQYIHAMLRGIDKKLQAKLNILYSEWPQRNFTTDIYKTNAANVRKMLKMPAYIHAFYENKSADSLYLNIMAFDGFPLVVKSITINEKPYNVLSQHRVIYARAKKETPSGRLFSFNLPGHVLSKLKSDDKITVEYTIPGLSTITSANVIPGIPLPVSSEHKLFEYVDIAQLPFAEINNEKQEVFIKPGSHTISQAVEIKPGFTLRMGPGTKIDMIKNACLLINGNVEWLGSADDPIEISSSDKTANGISITGKDGFNWIKHVSITNVSPKWAALSIAGNATLEDVNIHAYTGKYALFIKGKGIVLERVHVASLGMGLYHGKVGLSQCTVNNVAGIGIEIVGCNVAMSDTKISSCTKSGIKTQYYSFINGGNNRFEECGTAVQAEDGATVQFKNPVFSKCKTGVRIKHEKNTHGFASVWLKGSTFTNVKKQTEVDPGCKLTMLK